MVELGGKVVYQIYPKSFQDTDGDGFGDLRGVIEHLDYLAELGVDYLWITPFFTSPQYDNGYDIADYRNIDPRYGTMEDFDELVREAAKRGMYLMMDMVLNHTSTKHEWFQKALAGDEEYKDFYIFRKGKAPGVPPTNWESKFGGSAWEFEPRRGQYYLHIFSKKQPDLNWANPDVFAEFADLLLFLANNGVEVFRLDAIAFTWKVLGTDCQNEPPVHEITQALRAALRIVAPACALKAEAIVGPQDLIAYLGQGKHFGKVSDLAYHNSVMVQLWGALASRHTRLFEVALSNFPAKPASATWGTYVRCHDDIGWAIGDDDARGAYLEGHTHRAFLSEWRGKGRYVQAEVPGGATPDP